MTYSEIWHRIATSYDDGEARAIARILIEELFGLSYTDIVCGATEQLSADDTLRLDTAVRRIEQGEPLQHVLGYADFCGNRFSVNGSVLIPRPETEWLVDEGAKLMDGCIASDETQHKAPHSPKRILDIGTGSGCIAISLKLRLGDAYVEAWDISEEALRTAQDNADALKAEVVFRKRDALRAEGECLQGGALVSSAPTEQTMDSINYSEANILAAPWDLIVSNPPYICNSERSAMDDNVLLHEPHTALFVPDDDPLRFYRAIARYALLTLNIGGSLLFECNTRYAEATGTMLRDMGFEEVTVSDDCFGLPRFVRGSSPSQSAAPPNPPRRGGLS
ncbi:protein-(glutamine-N5) methyltransferase [Leyella stercorea DSM 18206]|uniref:Protein-(Glutamine-N5) methyltransferase n=1 Tax=Leyella stercorea DSM 18206 TaxID=1002367 RepID=G6AZ20_9BACT|nr:peptide chain release factor N(5)-glutamine methyltransferase [Leyella stercorea]EHJ38752.1 protein-(glutamine-N5) methyltransferase [Leyella stercorea DSM 18206]